MDNTKLKLLRILELLQKESSKGRPLTTTQICQKLEKMGMHCERRTLYRDIRLLIECGYDIEIVPSKTTNYYYYKKAPELSYAELKILIDAAEAASFIPEKETAEIVKKLSGLGGSRRKELLNGDLIHFNSRKHKKLISMILLQPSKLRYRITGAFPFITLISTNMPRGCIGMARNCTCLTLLFSSSIKTIIIFVVTIRNIAKCGTIVLTAWWKYL